jgi:glutathione S-transferase
MANKNYSSWSIRAWLAMKQTGAPFAEIVIPLDRPETAATIAAHSPSGLLPVLRHGRIVVWDSLAIAEYLAERFPDAGLWPKAAKARAVAAEMHSSFRELRTHMPINARATLSGLDGTDRARADLRRIFQLWRDCRARFGAGGAFLFGGWTIADAFFAPVVSRINTYAVDLDPVCRAYADAVLAAPAVVEWFAAARAEEWAIDKYDRM